MIAVWLLLFMLNDHQFSLLVEIQRRQVAALEALAGTMEQLAMTVIVASPNYEYSLQSFATFEWELISASVERVDRYGVAVVRWNGREFIRQSMPSELGQIIWFSRKVGSYDDGQNKYERLISFRPP